MRWLLVCACLWLPAGAAQAQGGAAAEVLFREGQALYDAGNYEEACPKFAASYELDPGLGTLLNLARCYEAAGRTASAWVTYVDLAPQAKRANQLDRARIAEERIAALTPRLMRLKLRVPQGVDGLEVVLDGKVITPELYGSAIPVDPGRHVVVARAPGRTPTERRVTVTDEGVTVDVAVEAPRPVATPNPPPAPPPRTTPAPAPPRPPPAGAQPPIAIEPQSNTALLAAGGVVGGVGLVTLAIGFGFTADAASSWSDARCSEGLCPDEGAQALSEQANRSADIATGLVVTGGIVAAAGLVLILVGVVDEPELTRSGLLMRF